MNTEDRRVRVGIVVLAAGEGSRMGSPKQLLDFGGKPLLRHAVDEALAAGCGPVAVVLGANADRIAPVLPPGAVTVLTNPRWPEGMGTSIHTGIQAMEAAGVDAAILTLGDQPLLTSTVFGRLTDLFRQSGKPIVTATYAGTVGVPVLFARAYFPLLMALEPNQGCKGVILKNRSESLGMDCPEAEADLDTPEEYQRALAALGR